MIGEEPAESEVKEVAVGDHALPGALTLPAGDVETAVILLAGSGPQDLDGTIGAAGVPFLKDLADGLAANRIASLRYTKVTKHAPASLDMKSFTLDDEYFDDAAAAIELLEQQPELSDAKIFVVGHSQGAMVMPEVLSRNSHVTGGVSMAGTPRSLFDVILDQNIDALEAQPDMPKEQREGQLKVAKETTELAKKIDSADDEVPLMLAQSMSAAYVASLNTLDAASTATQLGVPMLFVQGEDDRQVFHDTDFKAWQEELDGKGNVTFKSYPNLNHFFAPSTGGSAVADINSDKHMESQVSTDLAEWLTQNS